MQKVVYVAKNKNMFNNYRNYQLFQGQTAVPEKKKVYISTVESMVTTEYKNESHLSQAWRGKAKRQHQ